MISSTSGLRPPTYRSCHTVVANASVSQNSTGDPARAALSSASSCRRAINGKSSVVNSTSSHRARGSCARSAASLRSLNSRPYSGTQPVRAHTPPRAR